MGEGREQVIADCLDRRTDGSDWTRVVADAVPLPAAVMASDGCTLYANRRLQEMMHGEPGSGERQGGGSGAGCDELRPLLDDAVRTGCAAGEVRLGPPGPGGSRPTMQAHAGLLGAGADGRPLILVTWQQGRAETLRRAPATCETQIIGSEADISQWERAQEQLTNLQERLHVLFEYAPDAYYLSDLMGTFLDGNRAAEQLIGCPRGELIGKSFLKLDLLSRRQLPRAAGYLAKNALGHPVGPVEFRLCRKDGTLVYVEIRTYPVRIEGKNVVLGIARDISDRKKAEEVLKESEEKFKVIFEEAHEGIAYLDEVGHVLDVNKTMLEILQQTKDETVGKHFIELGLLDGGDVPRFMTHFQQVLLGTREPLSLSITNKQGELLFLECSASVVHKKAGVRGLVVLLHDVTERKRAEILLEGLNRDLQDTIRNLEQSNQELRDFAHVAAHDLKAPLRGIATLAEWVAHDCADQIDDRGRENLDLLRERVVRMIRLIDGILRYAEVGHGDRLVESVDTNQVVAEAIEQIAPPEHIRIQVERPLPVVLCERVSLTQVFQNLLSNAVKYMDKPRGEIRIAAVEESEFWKFTVADNGVGIESKDFDRLWQMFQTLRPAAGQDSTGIGLAVVKKIVQMHAGRVGVESQPGQGSTFFFTLPKGKETMTHEEC